MATFFVTFWQIKLIMRELTIQIKNNEDASLLLQLVNRLGLKVTKDTVSTIEEKKLERCKEIIMKGVEASEDQLSEMLKTLEENRKDRKLPFRKQ